MICLILGNHTQGLGIVRSLAPVDADTHLVNDHHVALARFSRHLNHYHRLPKGTLKNVYLSEYTKQLIAAIREIVPPGARWPVFCVHEDLVHFLHRNRPCLQDLLTIPENPILDIIDKYRFSQAMQQLGLRTPQDLLAKRVRY